ncbi:MAG: hypothetical protein WD971_00815 [Pirellulales bacterium]
MTKLLITFGVGLSVLIAVDTATAQRGTGEQQGVARQAVKPEVQTIFGTLQEIKTDPCEQTTGRSPIGTHLILQGENTTYNLHLGPASEVGDVVGMVRVGDTIEATAFRTKRLPENQYVAVTVKQGDQTITLRDDSLRPRWAGSGGRGGGQATRRGDGGRAGAGGGQRLAYSRVLGQSSQLQLSDEQVESIESILSESEQRIRELLTEEQLKMLDSRPRGGQGRRRGPR